MTMKLKKKFWKKMIFMNIMFMLVIVSAVSYTHLTLPTNREV